MAFKHLGFAILVLVIGFAGTSQAKLAFYTLAAGSGAQLHIGNGLALPIQPGATSLVTGQVFPPLLIPVAPGVQRVTATTTATGTEQKIVVKPGALAKAASQKTVGVFTSNPTLYAVGTALRFNWPTATATFSVSGRTGAATATFTQVTVPTNKIRYSPRIGGKRFGGAARFNLRPAFGGEDPLDPIGLIEAQVTIYAIGAPGPGNPPCVHTLLTPAPFPGPGTPACVAGIIEAVPSGPAAQGGPVGTTVNTDGDPRIPGGGIIAAGPGPLHPAGPPGTVSFFGFGAAPGTLTNDAMSEGFPWTTAMVSISAMSAMGGAEVFIISGDDTRTAGGAGTISMVSGSLSSRPLSGDNANRAWLRLVLEPNPQVPSMSVLGLATTAGLMLLTAGYAMRRRIFS